MKYQAKVEAYLSALGFVDIHSMLATSSYSALAGSHRFNMDFKRSQYPRVVQQIAAVLGPPDELVKRSYARWDLSEDRKVMLYQLNNPDWLQISLISKG